MKILKFTLDTGHWNPHVKIYPRYRTLKSTCENWQKKDKQRKTVRGEIPTNTLILFPTIASPACSKALLDSCWQLETRLSVSHWRVAGSIAKCRMAGWLLKELYLYKVKWPDPSHNGGAAACWFCGMPLEGATVHRAMGAIIAVHASQILAASSPSGEHAGTPDTTRHSVAYRNGRWCWIGNLNWSAMIGMNPLPTCYDHSGIPDSAATDRESI